MIQARHYHFKDKKANNYGASYPEYMIVLWLGYELSYVVTDHDKKNW